MAAIAIVFIRLFSTKNNSSYESIFQQGQSLLNFGFVLHCFVQGCVALCSEGGVLFGLKSFPPNLVLFASPWSLFRLGCTETGNLGRSGWIGRTVAIKTYRVWREKFLNAVHSAFTLTVGVTLPLHYLRIDPLY